MNSRSLSSSKKPSPAKYKNKKKKAESSRNPLQDFNATSNNSSHASCSSMEAPRGCLRFFLSHTSSSNLKTPITRTRPKTVTLSKTTPKSAPVLVRQSSKSKENRTKIAKSVSHKLKSNSSCLSNISSSRTAQKLKHCATSDFETKCGTNEVKSGSSDGTYTPLCSKSKMATGLILDSKVIEGDKSIEGDDHVQEKCDKGSNSKTPPPVEASVSPEIQFGSSSALFSSSSMACYAAGHLLSGITDKRKCRPRGILNAGDSDSAKPLCSFEEEEDDHATVKGMVDDGDDGDACFVLPLPAEASMHWLLSPCNEEDEEERQEQAETSFRDYAASINLAPEFSSRLCNDTVSATDSSRRRNTCISPSGVPRFQELLEPLNEHVPCLASPLGTPGCEGLTLKDKTQCIYDFEGESSPFSVTSLGSENVILTPQSDSSADKHAGMSVSTTDNPRRRYDCELSSVAEAIRMASLSPNNHVLIEDQTDSSFQFDCLTTTCDSISRMHKLLDDQDSWLSNSTLENVSQSQMRISWREGLTSRMYDMDEYDCCRCLSDEEEDTNACINDLFKKICPSPEITSNVEGDQIRTGESCSPEILDDEPGVARQYKDLPQSCACAESISTDGGGLLASGDSDWTLCYKNGLFHE